MEAAQGAVGNIVKKDSLTEAIEVKKPSSSQFTEAVKDIAFGSAAGIVGKFIEYPFDTVKVRLQSQPDHLPLRYRGPLDCFQQSFRQDGFLGLYRGISAPLAGAAIEISSMFLSYRLTQNALQATIYPSTEPLPISALVACGGAAGAFTSYVLTPIELIKCKMQVPSKQSSAVHRAPGPLTLIASVYKHEGLRGFWRGQLGTLIRETGGSAAWFGSYESMSTLFRHLAGSPSQLSRVLSDDNTPLETPSPLPVYQQMLAGAVAGMSYNFLFYPADTIKSVMQTEEIGSATPVGKKKTFLSVGRAMWTQQGFKGLYRGCGITVGRSAPSSAFIFTVYEGLKETFS
ncbi:MAG: hypothetical protein M1812_001659 [Candelaria pacifica]|nr:MAG: hypothetical protein M1812_001659 [Candelaria pacifica]